MESNSFRVIPLLSISLPCRGIIYFRYREHTRRRLIIEADTEESRVVALLLDDVVKEVKIGFFDRFFGDFSIFGGYG